MLYVYQLLAFKWRYRTKNLKHIKRKITSLVQSSECIQVTRGANVNQFVFCDATSDRLSEVMKQCAQNVILIIQL